MFPVLYWLSSPHFATLTELIDEVAHAKEIHIKDVKRERGEYALHKEMSHLHPESCFTLICDAMDQNKLRVPHLHRYPKKLDAQLCPKLGLMACKCVWGDTTSLHFFPNVAGRFQRNANGPINAIVHTLAQLKRRGPLPPTAFFQFDNCPTENKSKAFYVLLALLVALNVFKELITNFGIVGHTHEDIDQTFSTYARALQLAEAWLPQDMVELLRNSFKSVEVHVSPERQQVDYVSWVSTVMKKFSGVKKPRVIKFVKNADGDVVLLTKARSSDAEWSAPLVLLDRASVRALVEVRPTYVPLAPFKVDPFLAGLEACVDAGMASEDVLLGWQDFAEAERDAEVGYCATCLDLRAGIASSMPKNKDKNDMERYRALNNHVRRLARTLNATSGRRSGTLMTLLTLASVAGTSRTSPPLWHRPAPLPRLHLLSSGMEASESRYGATMTRRRCTTWLNTGVPLGKVLTKRPSLSHSPRPRPRAAALARRPSRSKLFNPRPHRSSSGLGARGPSPLCCWRRTSWLSSRPAALPCPSGWGRCSVLRSRSVEGAERL